MPSFPIDNNVDILQSISDTLNVIGPKVYQIAEASDPEMVRQGFTWSVVAAFAGICGAVFGLLSFWFAKRTADNVKRTNKKNRLRISDRVVKIVYRRMVYIRALLNDRSLISQNLLRSIYLPDFDDCFILEDYRNHADMYSHLMTLKSQMNKYDDVIDACINKLDNHVELSDRDLLDLLESPVKILIELYNINKGKKKKYADRIISTIIQYHFDIGVEDLVKFKGVSFSLPSTMDPGVTLLLKLCKESPLKKSRCTLLENANEHLKSVLASYVEEESLNTYITLLEQSVKQDNDDNDSIFTWLPAAWGLDSAIVQKQFESYYETTI